MNYTTIENVKAALGASETTDDALLTRLIDEASRVIDTTICHAQANYFENDDKAVETINGLLTSDGAIICWPSKAIVNSVTSFEYRLNPRLPWVAVDVDAVTISNNRQVTVWGESPFHGKCFVHIGYDGGYGTEEPATEGIPADPDAVPPVVEVPAEPAVITGLPSDVIDAATVLTVRFYKEEKGGLTDAIGVAELGTMQYTKALPARVVEMLKPYKRIVV